MHVYIEKQGKRINKIINNLSRYAKSIKTTVNLVLEYSDYHHLNKIIKKEPNNVTGLSFIFDFKNISYSRVRKTLKYKSRGNIYLKVSKNLPKRIIRLLNSKKMSKIEIILINEINADLSKLNKKNIIDSKNYKELDCLSLICNLEERYGCNYSSCLGKRFFIDKEGNISFCYKKESNIGNVINKELTELISKSELFKSLLLKSINRRKECKEKCSYFSLCKGGCILEDRQCNEFISLIGKEKEELKGIIDSSFNLKNEHLSKENIILWYISRYHNVK